MTTRISYLSSRHLQRFILSRCLSSYVNNKSFTNTLLLPKTSFILRPDPKQIDSLYRKLTCDDLYRWQVWYRVFFLRFWLTFWVVGQCNRSFIRFTRWSTLRQRRPAHGYFTLLLWRLWRSSLIVFIGHALNKVIKDIINRFHVLQGRKVQYVCFEPHISLELPLTTRQVSCQDGIVMVFQSKTKRWRNRRCVNFHFSNLSIHRLMFEQLDPLATPASEIRRAAEATAQREINSQKEQFRQLGIMADWDSKERTYRTFGMYILLGLRIVLHLLLEHF